MKSYSLFELNEFIRRTLMLNLADPIWISCEIAQINLSKGNYYLELIQKSETGEEIIARTAAIIWQKKYYSLRANLGKELETILQDGMAILAKFRVDFHERYGLKLVVEEIDLSYSLGKLALQRRDTVQQLEALDLLGKNAALGLAPVLQNIAVISSHRAAGYQDFKSQLQQNEWGFHFKLNLFSAAVQGVFAPEEMLLQLKKINGMAEYYDAVVIIRGGGAKLDLMAFDDFDLCKMVAHMKLPVLTGIGHDVDDTVMDLVAHTSLKTPTAVASYLIDWNLHYEAQLLQYGKVIGQLAAEKISGATFHLRSITQKIQLLSQGQLAKKTQALAYKEKELIPSVRNFLKLKQQQVRGVDNQLRILDPQATLQRGYSLTTQDGIIIKNPERVADGTEITTHFEKATLKSIVKKST